MQIVGCGQGSNGGIAYRCGNLAITFGDGVASGKNTRHLGLHIRIYHHFTPLVQGDLPLQEFGIGHVANEDKHPSTAKRSTRCSFKWVMSTASRFSSP